MFEKLGKRKFAVPLLVAVIIACVMSVMFYPMANMEMKGLPFAMLSLDEGVEGPQGTVNAGDALIENVTAAVDAGDGESPIAWTQVGSQEELDEALENGEFYGALIVPEGFSAGQMAAKQAAVQAALAQAQALAAAQAPVQAAAAQGDGGAAGAAAGEGAAAGVAAVAGFADAGQADQDAASNVETPSLKVVVDNAKSPLVASQTKASMASMFQQMGVDVEVETIHEGDAGSADDAAAANPMAGMMSQQLTIMPLFLMSFVGALVLSRVFKTGAGASRAERWKSLAVQAAYAVAVSLVASLCAYAMLVWVVGSGAAFGEFALFMWFASFCVMLLFLGAFNLSLGLGVLVALCALAGGMTCGVLPFEALPSFWQDWVYPWAPQHFIGEGVRAVMFRGAGAWNAGSGPLAVIGAVGVVLACVAGTLPRKGARNADV